MKHLLYLTLVVSCIACSNQKQEKQAGQQKPQNVVVLDGATGEDTLSRIGCDCGAGGEATIPFKKLKELLLGKQYTAISELLKTGTAAERCLATVICEKLASNKLIKLTKTDTALISSCKKSLEKVYLCSGCLMHNEYMLWELFPPSGNGSELEWIIRDFDVIISEQVTT